MTTQDQDKAGTGAAVATWPVSDWEQARIMGSRTFYEHSTDTIRTCPENYCLAHRDDDKRWKAFRWEGSTRFLHDKIQQTIDTWQGGSTAAALAKELGKLMPDKFHQ